jgi:hypothetical protein
VASQLSDADKARVRDQLPAGLGCPESKVRTAVGAAIAAIYNFDGDSGWPGLTEALVAAVQQRSDANLGAVPGGAGTGGGGRRRGSAAARPLSQPQAQAIRPSP